MPRDDDFLGDDDLATDGRRAKPVLPEPPVRLSVTVPIPRPRSSMGPPPPKPAPSFPRFDPQERRAQAESSGTFVPAIPKTVADAGLTTTFVEELLLKTLFFAGELRGTDLVFRLKLPAPMVDDAIESLRQKKLIDQKGSSGMGVGKSTMVYTVTTFATDLLKQLLERNRYAGPAPVRLEEWALAVSQQSIRKSRVTAHVLGDACSDLVMSTEVLDALGPAMNGGRSVFLYGAPGNGKTALCRRLVRCFQGDIFIPHALLVDDFVIRLFDPTVHEPVEAPEDAGSHDARWVRCRRPLVVTGGELTLETLDLIYSPDVRYYEASFQLKATNGMLLIDDFGRQRASPKDLLNRWIVPLENDVDYLTLHTGKKIQVPFDVFTAFSTNLEPAQLVDDAFLRRVRYKVEVPSPSVQQYISIFEFECSRRGIPFEPRAAQYFVDAHVVGANRVMAGCQPRDIVGQLCDIAAYRNQRPQLSKELLDAAARHYFARFHSV